MVTSAPVREATLEATAIKIETSASKVNSLKKVIIMLEYKYDNCFIDPCFAGMCVNTNGGFQCQCSSASTGHLCQYSTDCQDPNTCSDGK